MQIAPEQGVRPLVWEEERGGQRERSRRAKRDGDRDERREERDRKRHSTPSERSARVRHAPPL